MAKHKTKKHSSSKAKIDAKPLTETQIAYFVQYHTQHNNFPGLKIPCSVSGKLTTCVGAWKDKKIKEFGSVENLLRNYKSRGVIKSERVKSEPVKVKRVQKDKIAATPEETRQYSRIVVANTGPLPLDNNDIKSLTTSQCFRPDLFLDNKRNCEGCNFYADCNNKSRCLPKGVKFKDNQFVAA